MRKPVTEISDKIAEPADETEVSPVEETVDDTLSEEAEEPESVEITEEPEPAVRGSMLLAAEPTRASAYLRMIDMDQYSYSFGSNYPEPYKNQSRRRTVQFWFGDTPAYCLQFGKEAESGMAYSTTDVWDGISAADKHLLSWVLMFGYIGWCRYGAETSQEYMATQVLIWQILTHTVNTSWEQAICDEMMGSGSYAQEVYWKIKANVYAADKIPSFCSGSDNSSTPVYDLEKGTDGKYSVKLTDTNGVLGSFSFSAEGAYVTRDGNTLTVTTDAPMEELTLSANKSFSGWTLGNVLFWKPGNTSGYQYMGSFDTGKAPDQVKAVFRVSAPVGTLDVRKTSSNTQYTNENAMYSFEGTTFEVYDSEGVLAGTLVADAEGKTEALDLPAGTYTVKETKVGKGYIRNTETKTVTITPGETSSISFANDPIPDPGSLYLRKWDRDTDRPAAQGTATLKGAQYRIDYYDNTTWSGSPKASWVFETDANGVIRYDPAHKVSGSDLYSYHGAYEFPLGSIKVTEVKAPAGYLMSADCLYATITQNGNTAKLTWTTETQSLIKAYGDGWAVFEDVIYGGVRFKKVDAETGSPLSGAEISIYNNSDAEILVNGTLYSKGDLIVSLTTGENGVCETAKDLLPYGSYYAVETKPSDRYLLNEDWRADFRITTDGEIVDCTTGSNLLKEQIIRGGVRFKKADKETGLPVSGAEISIYSNSDDKVLVNGTLYSKGDLIASLMTDENGACETSATLLPYGSYYAVETKPSDRYLLNEDWRIDFSITENGKIVDFTSENDILQEQIIRGGVRFKKVDAETGLPVSGAEISIYSNSEAETLAVRNLYANGDLITSLTTDENGVCETASDLLPYGSYYAVETGTVDRYLLNEDWRVDFSITADGEIVDCTTGSNLLKEQIIRGDLSMLKLDIGGNYKANVPFMIVKIEPDGTEGEWHVIVSDENGMIDTSASSRPHTSSTNSLDEYVDGGTFTNVYKLDPSVGVWFGDSEPDDSLGALPYGLYKVYELQTEQLAADQVNILESKIIEITEPNETVVLTPMVNLNITLTSEASSADGHDFIPTAATVRVFDTVHYNNLTSGRKYTMETQFILKSTSEVLGSVSKDFYPPEDTTGTNTAGGSVTLEADIDVSGHQGDYVVACDYLYEYVKGTKVMIARHTDMDDPAQTLRIPEISTNAKDSSTNDSVGTVSGNAEIIDTVNYTNLKRGELFMLVAKLGDVETGETIKGSDGKDLIVEKTFVCTTETGSVEMPAFVIDSTQYCGRSVVVLEELYWIDEENDNAGTLMASHISFDDKDQTITYPEIHTTASDSVTESHAGTVSESTVIVDSVQLNGLVIGSEYTVSGALVYQEDFTDKNNEQHEAGDTVPIKEVSKDTVTFTADAKTMTVTLSYIVDSTALEGHAAVVFEDLIHNGTTVTSHADLTDKEQTVWFPSLKTRAIDKTSDTSFVTQGTEVVFVDTVDCEDLVAGDNYRIHGKLIDKETGKPLGYETYSDPFTAENMNETVEVEFIVNTEKLDSGIIVVFEDLYLVKEDGTEVLVVKHEDLDDEGQSLYYPEIGTTAVNAATETHEVQGKSKVTLKDTVSYKNLKAGEEYAVVGILMDKEKSEPILINGEYVTSSVIFVPAEKDGQTDVYFEFDASDLFGKTVVVFESLFYESVEIAVHADIEDDEQSINVINIRTTAVDAESGTHTATWKRDAEIVDTVSYTGLTPGKTYTVYGTVMLKGTGEDLYQNGVPVAGMTEFTPEKPDGTVDVSFTLNTFILQDMDIVVFEYLFAGSVMNGDLESEIPIATHEDLYDDDQTVYVPEMPREPVNTGVNSHIGLYFTAMLTSGAGLVWLYNRRKRH